MAKPVSSPNTILRDLHKSLGPGRRIPNAKVPWEGIDIQDALDPVLVKQFEETIKSDEKIRSVWDSSYKALKNYAMEYEFDGNPSFLSAQELIGAKREEVMDFKLVLSILHIYAQKDYPAIRSFQVVGQDVGGDFIPLHELEGPGSRIINDPLYIEIDVKKAGKVTFRIGPIEKTFPVASGSQVIKVLKEREARVLKREQRQIGIELQNTAGETQISLTVPIGVRIGRNRRRPKPTPGRRQII